MGRARFPLAVAALLALALPVAASAAEPARGGPLRSLVTVRDDIVDVAYAGRTRLYATRDALMRLAPGRRPVRVARLDGLAIQLEASASTVALVVERGRTRRLLAGPPHGPLRELARCRGRSREMPYALFALAGDVVVEALSCAGARAHVGAHRLRIHDGGAVRELPAPPGRRFVWVAGAPGVLATVSAATTADDPRGSWRLAVRDLASGAVRYTVEGISGAGVDPTVRVDAAGTAVFCDAQGRLTWASPAQPAGKRIPRGTCPYVDGLALAGGRVAYAAGSLVVSDLAGRHRRVVTRSAGGLPFDWDGRRTLIRGLGCGTDFLGEFRPRAHAYRGATCDVRVAGVAREDGRRTVAVTLDCPAGCRGELMLALGRAHYRLFQIRRPGQQIFRFALAREARAELLRYVTVPYAVLVNYVQPAYGASAQPLLDYAGELPGDGAEPYPPPPEPPPSD